MALAATYNGSDYQQIEARLFMAVDQANGRLLTPDPEGGEYFPRLTWGQIVALAAAWKRAAARSTLRWSGWYDLMKYALGYDKPGDRFIMTKQWANTTADPASTAMFWKQIGQLAQDLDSSKTKIAPLYVDWTWAGYEAAARDAWSQMKIEREAPVSSPDPKLTPAEAEASESSGWGGAILLIALLIAAGKASKKGS